MEDEVASLLAEGAETEVVHAALRQALRRALGDRIRARRKELGLTQEALALRAGRDRAYVGSIERGAYGIGVVNLAYLAHALDTDVGTLTAGLNLDPFAGTASVLS